MVRKMLEGWSAEALATAADRAGKLERSLMLGPGIPPAESLGEELVAVARAARRR